MLLVLLLLFYAIRHTHTHVHKRNAFIDARRQSHTPATRQTTPGRVGGEARTRRDADGAQKYTNHILCCPARCDTHTHTHTGCFPGECVRARVSSAEPKTCPFEGGGVYGTTRRRFVCLGKNCPPRILRDAQTNMMFTLLWLHAYM